MPDKTIGELPAISALQDASLLPVEQSGTAYKMSGAQLKTYATADIISAQAQTLAAGSSATASYNTASKILTLGIPQGIQGERGEQGAQGIQGETGRGFAILGYYNTLSALEAAVPSPQAGDAYGIGTVQPYLIYIWDGVNQTWVNNGAMQGPNEVSTSTATNITGILKGANGYVDQAVAGADYATPQSVNTKITDPSTKTSGDVLTYNGSAWVAQQPSGGEMFYVTFSDGPHSDKTYEEVKAAYDAGKTLVGIYGNTRLFLSYVTSTEFGFTTPQDRRGGTTSYYIKQSATAIGGTNPLNRDNMVTSANTDYSTVMVRGISAGTSDLTAGTSSLISGAIYLVYE